MKVLTRRSAVGAVLLAVMFALAPLSGHAQDAGKRRIVARVAPVYPELARNMGLEGVVKIDALVGPDGTVKNLEIKGGAPVLVEAAAGAVRKWRWEPAAHESHELVEVKFSPH